MLKPGILALSLVCAAPSFAQSSAGLFLIAGNGQVVREQFLTQTPFTVQARDASGNPLANVPINWSVTQGSGTINGASAATDAKGLATANFLATDLQAGYSFSANTVTAASSLGNVNFVVTTALSRLANGLAAPPLVVLTAPPPNNPTVTGRAGSTIPRAVSVAVGAQSGPQSGAPVPNVSLRIVDAIDPTASVPASCNGPGGVVLTDSTGVATCDLVLANKPGSYQLAAEVGEFQVTPSFLLTITPGAPCTFTLSSASSNAPAAGGTGVVSVTTGASCTYTATSNVPWISITSGASGSGSGSVQYSVTPLAAGSASRSGALTVAGQTFTVNQSAAGAGGLAATDGPDLPPATVAVSYSKQLLAAGGTAPYTWQLVSGALPPGLTLASTGIITGTPTTAGTASFSVTLRDSAGALQTISYRITTVAASAPGAGPRITNTSFPDVVTGTAYLQAITVAGGCVTPFNPAASVKVSAGALPTGLSLQQLSDRSFVISGTTSAPGVYPFTLAATDACGTTTLASFTLRVGSTTPGGSSAITVTPAAIDLTPGASQTLTVVSSGASVNVNGVASTAEGIDWLDVQPASAPTAAKLVVSLKPAAATLPAGVHQGTITIFAPSLGSQVAVPVRLTIPAQQRLTVDRNALSFTVPSGFNPVTDGVRVDATAGVLSYTVTASTVNGGNWLLAPQGTLQTPSIATISINPAALAPGTYTATLGIAAQGVSDTKQIPVVLTVLPSSITVAAITNAASFAAGSIAPGEFVTIFGTNLGPPTLIGPHLTQQGTLDTSVSDTRVLFDGIPAPIVYTSASQVTAIAPYTIAGRTSVRVEVEFRGTRSTAVTVPVADSAPALFTVGSTSQGAILNQNGTLNTPQNGAPAGSIVSLYATGEGLTDLNLPDGTVIGDALAKPRLPVTVTIGGTPAEVTYAGSAPGLPGGVLQVNVRVPADAGAGPAEILLKVGDATSQSGVQLTVR